MGQEGEEMRSLKRGESTGVAREEETEEEGGEWYDINTQMLSSKFAYFFQNAKDSCYLPYMILFLSSTGLTPQQAGTVNGVRFIGFIVGAPVWAVLADYTRRHTFVVLLLCLSSLLLMTALPFLSIPLSVGVGGCGEDYGIRNMTNNFTTTALPPGDYGTSEGVDHGTLFAVMMLVTLVTSCFDGSTQGFVDAGVIQKISTTTRKVSYGTQRLFGAIGYGVGAFASSLAMEWFKGMGGLPCYTPVFIVYGLFMFALTISTHRLFTSLTFATNNPTDDIPGRTSRSMSVTSDVYRERVSVGKALRRTLCKFRMLFFLSTLLVVGTVHAIYIGFLFVLLRDINCPNIVMGLSIVVGALASAVGIILSEGFIHAFGGTLRVLCIGCASWALRFLLFAYLYDPWLVLPIQLLQGFGYGLFIAGKA